MPAADYTALPGNPPAFVIPNRPALLIIPAGTNALGQANMKAQYDADLNTWRHWDYFRTTMNTKLVDIFGAQYLESVRHPDFGLLKLTPFEILQCIFTNYGQITIDDLHNNKQIMGADWDLGPIETLYNRFTECQRFAIADPNPINRDPISDTEVKTVLLKVLEKSGVLMDAIRDYRKLPTACLLYTSDAADE